MKGLIQLYGQQPEYTHNISKLVAHCNNLEIAIPDELDIISDTLTVWESSSRYDIFINFSKRKYDLAKEIYSEIENSLSYEIEAIEATAEEIEP